MTTKQKAEWEAREAAADALWEAKEAAEIRIRAKYGHLRGAEVKHLLWALEALGTCNDLEAVKAMAISEAV